jgi:type I restriction enzyme S subunit
MTRAGNETTLQFFEHSISEEVRQGLRARAFPAGAIVFPKIGAAIATNKKRLLTRASCIDNNVMAVAPRSALEPRFLFYLFAGKNLSEFANDSNPPSIRKTTVEEWQIPVPPLAEQRRLVARIETLTSRLEQARQARQAALAEAETAQAALVDAVFVKREGEWDEATVKQLCGQPQYGYTESASRERVGPHFLRITDIQDGNVNWETVPFCVCAEPAKYRLADGDIVFARTGATTGKSYLAHNPPEAVFASYLIRIRPGERVLPEYVWWYFRSSGYWASVFSGVDDGNRPNMNGSKLAAVRIPFPKSRDEQRRIVGRLDALAAKQTDLRRLQTETEAELAAFTPALLAKAFHGEL